MPVNHVKTILIQCGIAVTVFILFLLIFRMMQEPEIYNKTLAKVSTNYKRVGDWNNWQIFIVKEPYIQPTDENLYNWDADIYRCIRDYAYKPEGGYTKIRHAFFPLFPLFWKATGLGSRHIGYVNFGLLAIALMFLSNALIADQKNRIFFFASGLLFPSVIFYHIPYSEAVFTLTMAIAVWGLMKQKYWLYFLGMMAMGMARPAVIIFAAAFITVELIALLRHRNFKYFIKEFFIKAAPLFTGFFAALAYQFYYTKSWTSLFDAQKYWPGSFGIPSQFSDWSIEGFGMSVFALCFLCLPAIIYMVFLGVSAIKRGNDEKKTKQNFPSILHAERSIIKSYFFNISLAYIAIMMLYTILFKEGSLNSFSRYIMASPFMYIILYLLPERLKQISFGVKFSIFLLSLFSLIIFLFLVEYGGDKFSFNYLGMYLGILLAAIIYFEVNLSFRTKIILLILLAILCILWHTYLYNSFISNGWIFT